MEIIIEYDKNSSLGDYVSNYICIGYNSTDDTYCLIYNKINYNISKDEVNELFDTFEFINLKIMPNCGMGVDGETYSLKISNGWNSISFNWWSETFGEQWRGLKIFRTKINELKDKCIRK